MKNKLFTLLFVLMASVVTAFSQSFIGFEVNNGDLGTQIQNGLIYDTINMTLVETDESKYSINLVDAGEGTFKIGGITFYHNGQAGNTAFKTYGTYIQPNGNNREIRIPTVAGELVTVRLTADCSGLLVNGVSTNLWAGDNVLTAKGDSIVLKVADNNKPKISAILSTGMQTESTYTVFFRSPYLCDNTLPAVKGDFNNWGTPVAMHDTTDYWGDSYYTVTFDAMPDGQISYCNTAGDALMRYRYGEWMEVSAYTLNAYETEIYTYYDNDRQYRFSTCTPPAKHAVAASVLVPTDCGMDVTNGLYIYYWGEDSSNKQYMQMTAGEGRKFTATFDPNYFLYGYYFANGLDELAEGYKRTYEQTNLKADTLCWEVSYASANQTHSLESDDNCDHTDHNFLPYNLQAVNTSMDTVLFTWSVDTPMYAYNFRLYNEQGDQIYYKYVSSYNLTDNSYKDAVGLSEATHVAYWQLSAVTDNWVYYDATGEGFDIAGDTRRPHNLTVEETSEGVYTLRWEGEGVDHFHIIVSGGSYNEYDTTALTYTLTLEDNNYYYVSVEGRSASEDSFGSVELNFDTYKQDPRDITLYFYIPESAEFFNGAGGAIIWRDATMGGNHIVPLEADGENGHWYKAVVANFRRNSFRFTLMNGATEETAMKFLEYNSNIYQDTYFLLYTTPEGSQTLTTSDAQNVYPHDYAVYGLHAEQYMNKMILSWSANEQASNYRIYIYKPDGSYDTYSTEDAVYNYTELNNTDTVTMTWKVVPMGDWWNEYYNLAVNGEFTAAPSPFIPKNLQAVNNNDGTFTFSWDPIPYDTVRYFYLSVRDARNSEVAYKSDIRLSHVTLPVSLLFSGKYTMNVVAMDSRYNYLGQATDTFEVAPVAPHDIHIRVLMNLSSTYDLSDGLKFRITKRPDSTFVVAATEERYGWWSYTLNTDQYGAQFSLENTYSSVRIYGDTCMEYTDYLRAADCDARATDYVPHHLRATANSDGTYNLSWLVDMTDKVREYNIEVQHPDSGWYDNKSTQSMECNTSVLPYTGTYIYTIQVRDNNWNTIGRATDTIRIAPMDERTMTLRVLEQPLEEGWAGYRIYANWNVENLTVEDEPGNTGWSYTTIRSDQPAVHIELDSRWGEYTDFWMIGDTCIQVDNGFKQVACDAARQDFTLTNLHAEALGNGRVQFTWDCPDNPEQFYIQTLKPDSIPLTFARLDGDARTYTTLLNVDTTTEISWYLYAVKQRGGGNYPVSSIVWGDTITVEPSRYAPQNLQALDNNDGTYFVSWNAQPDTVAYYQVQIQYPNGDRNGYTTRDTTFVTPLLREIDSYYIYVYSMNRNGSNIGWQSVPVTVRELDTPRDITVRVLLHPDSERDNPGSLEVKRADGNSDYIDAVAEANHWFAYTFSSTRLVQPIRLLYTDKDVVADTCFEYSSQLQEVACDAVAHDYRIDANSLQAVSETGKVTFTWSAAEKSERYEIYARYYYAEYGWWRTLFDETVTDTSYVYMVPANMDGVEIEWSVRPRAPHSLNSVDANNPVLLHKSQIVISNMLFTTTDSMTYHFAWQANTDTVQYEIQINQYYSDNWPVRQAQVTTTSFDYTFISSDVTYGWQVRAVNAQGEPLSAWTVDTLDIRTKPGMKAITNIQGTAQGRTLTFTWDSPTSVSACQLYYYDAENRWYAVIDNDSMLYTNTFTYETTADGRYELILMPFVEVRPGEYAPLQERQWGQCNVFTSATFSVNVSASTGGRIWDNPSGNYPAGFEVWLDAVEEDHYRFVGWSDGVTDQNRLLVVSQDTTLIALFELRQEYTLTLDASTGGKLRIYLNEQLETTHYLAIHNEANSPWVEAIANEGYTFYQWSDGVTESNRTVRLLSDTAVTAIFMPICHATITAGEGGRVQVTGGEYDRTTGQCTCAYGTELTIKALPDEGYRFTAWSDGNTGVTRTIVITSDTVLTASFTESTTPLEQYVVRVSSNDTELGTVSSVSGAYYEGDEVTITATPKENTYFVQWSDGNTDATRVITVSQDTTLIATFAYKRFTLVIRAAEGGTVNDSTANGTYDYNAWVTITATPNEHYRFVQWSDGNTSASRSIRMTENIDLTATFAVEQFLVTFLNADGTLIEANRWDYGQTPVCSTTPTKEPTAEHRYVFVGWTPEITAVTGNAVYTAVYDSVARTYMITFVDEDGTVLSAREWEYGATPTCAEPTKADDEQYTYTFAGWNPAVVAVTGEATYTATYTATKKPEGFEEVNADGKAVKVFKDGVIYILRGDKIYTPTGSLVE